MSVSTVAHEAVTVSTKNPLLSHDSVPGLVPRVYVPAITLSAADVKLQFGGTPT